MIYILVRNVVPQQLKNKDNHHLVLKTRHQKMSTKNYNVPNIKYTNTQAFTLMDFLSYQIVAAKHEQNAKALVCLEIFPDICQISKTKPHLAVSAVLVLALPISSGSRTDFPIPLPL